MRIVLSVCMYSGAMNPETELTQEQWQEILDRVSKLNTPTVPNIFGLGSLGSDHLVVFPDPSSEEKSNILLVRALHGIVQVYSKGNLESYYQDTQGVGALLSGWMAPALAKYFEGASKQTPANYQP